MHCVLLNSPCGDAYWRLHRSVEVLGYHDTEVRILLALYLENLAPAGVENYLGMMHRGHVECAIVPAWPLPQHPDEPQSRHSAKTCVLRQLYGAAFFEDSRGLFQRKGLTKWDAWHSVDERRVIPEKDSWKLKRTSECLHAETGAWVPFTTWRLGPFTESTFYLVTCVLRFAGETYHELVDQRDNFTVDGPSRLLTRIKYEDLFRLPREDREKWIRQIEPFDSARLLLSDEYDVIILAPPLANEVHAYSKIGISLARLQPVHEGRHLGDRFITSDPGFSMIVKYGEGVPFQITNNDVRQAV